MINLLPPKEKEELSLEKNKKLAIVLGNVILISLVCLTLVLFSLKFYMLGEVNDQKNILNSTEKKYLTPDIISTKSLIQNYNTVLTKIDSFYKKEIYFSDALKTISNIQKPKGVYITKLSIDKIKDVNKVKVSISGSSDTRDNLLIFKNNIERDEKITNVYLPTKSLVKPADVDFSLTFETNSAILKK